MPKRKAIVTERKILLAFLIKAGDAEAVQAGKLFEGRPITSREQADAEFFAQFVGEELHRFLYSKLVTFGSRINACTARLTLSARLCMSP